MPVPFPTNAGSPRWSAGLVLNKSQLSSNDSVFTGGTGAASYTLAIVEFDDQGLCFGTRQQMKALEAQLTTLEGKNAIVVVFAHGWKHDGRLDDDNLTNFRAVLQRTASLARPNQPVLGVFIAWRGLSWYGFGVVENLTFWTRKEAAMRVALGSVRELLGRLRSYRENERLRTPKSNAVLVVIGHSFGGLIVYSAVAQSLIEAAATQPGQIVPAFASLVLLVNPAFEAVRYLPIHQAIEERTAANAFLPGQPPVFVSATARNDWATGMAFPIGMFKATLGESVRGRCEREALIKTMGHLDWMKTHELSAPGVAQRAKKQAPLAGAINGGLLQAQLQRSQAFAQNPSANKTQAFNCGAQLQHVPPLHPLNPFWVVQATPQVIDGHDGIWGSVFIDFVQSLVIQHL